MSKLRRIVLLRHGETVGNSKERFHGNLVVLAPLESLVELLGSDDLGRTVEAAAFA